MAESPTVVVVILILEGWICAESFKIKAAHKIKVTDTLMAKKLNLHPDHKYIIHLFLPALPGEQRFVEFFLLVKRIEV